MTEQGQVNPSANYEEAVQAAYRLITSLLPPGREKIFAFAPGRDLPPPFLRHHTATRKKFERFKHRLAATIRLQRPLAPNLSKAAADIIEGKQPRFRKKPDKELLIIIGMAVEEASRILPTKYRNEATDSHSSACDAVAQAAILGGLDDNMSYGMVAKRYKQYLRMKRS